MVIRCERCSTLYELDEGLLAATGSPVQCTRCQHVFTALPPRAAGRTVVGVPTASAEPRRDVPDIGARATGASAPRPIAKSQPPPVYRPATSAPVGRAPVLKRNTVGSFEARLRWTARWRWLGPSLAAALVLMAVVAWLFLFEHAPHVVAPPPVAPHAGAPANDVQAREIARPEPPPVPSPPVAQGKSPTLPRKAASQQEPAAVPLLREGPPKTTPPIGGTAPMGVGEPVSPIWDPSAGAAPAAAPGSTAPQRIPAMDAAPPDGTRKPAPPMDSRPAASRPERPTDMEPLGGG